MFVTDLSLLDFRSYQQVDITFEKGINLLVGKNGQGKTNIVEAIGYISTLSSHRVASDIALVRQGAERAFVRLKACRGERTSLLELEIIAGKANRARINRSPLSRPRQISGILKTVLFAPEDLSLVKGDPATRRKFIDDLTVQLSPRMGALLGDYDKVLRQRNALLKSAVFARRTSRSEDLRTLEVWNDKLVSLGSEIIAWRAKIVAHLKPLVKAAYRDVSSAQGEAELTYQPNVELTDFADDAVAQAFTYQLQALAGKEIERGVSLLGPHRDELGLTISELPAKSHASHGESWSLALSLKLACFHLLADPGSELWVSEYGIDAQPVLLLDDVFAELDQHRRRKLAEHIKNAQQVIITAAVLEDIPSEITGNLLKVEAGTVLSKGVKNE